jgi:hypothetical protein
MPWGPRQEEHGSEEEQGRRQEDIRQDEHDGIAAGQGHGPGPRNLTKEMAKLIAQCKAIQTALGDERIKQALRTLWEQKAG